VECCLPNYGKDPPEEKDRKINAQTVNIRGMYFKNTISTTIFIPFTGTVGCFVINNVPPTDPKVQKMVESFIPRQPKGTEEPPGTPMDIIQPDGSRQGPNLIPPSSIQPKQTGIFYPLGVVATGKYQLICLDPLFDLA